MKKQLMTLALIFSLPVVKADQPATGQFAVLKPKKACEVQVPEGDYHNRPYFSEDCQTAYVLPSLSMTKTVVHPFRTADRGICERFELAIQSKKSMRETDYAVISNYNKMIKALSAKLDAESDEGRRTSIQDEIDRSTAQRDAYASKAEAREKNLMKVFAETNAMRAKISLASDQMSEVAKYQEANKGVEAANNRPVRFVPAEIASSVVAIGKKDTSEEVLNPTVLKVDFPGVKLDPKKFNYPSDATLLKMNGSLSGIVDLNAIVFCEAVAKIKKAGGDVDSDTEDNAELKRVFDSAVQMNLDFNVKAQAGAKITLKSTLKTKDLVEGVSAKVEKTYYTRDEFMQVVFKGLIHNDLQVSIDDKGDSAINILDYLEGAEETDSTTAKMLSSLVQVFISEHFNGIEARFERFGIYEKMNPMKVKEMEPGITREVVRTETVCNTTRKLFKKVQNCSLQPVYVEVNHKGLSELARTITDNTEIINTATYDLNQTIEVPFTSSFNVKL